MLAGRNIGVVLAVLLILSAILVAGCGDGGDDTTGASATLTKAEFRSQGDAICRTALIKREKQVVKFSEDNDFTYQNATDKQLEEAVTQVVLPILSRQTQELDALGAPEGEEDQVEEIIVSLEGAADEIEQDPAVALEGEAMEEPGELAKAYGFQVCGQV